MTVKSSDDFQDKIYQAFDSGSDTKASLLTLRGEAEKRLVQNLTSNEKRFYLETINLISSSLTVLNLCSNVQPKALSAVNNKIIEIVEQEAEVYNAIVQTFREAVPKMDKKDVERSFPKEFVDPQYLKLNQLVDQFKTLIGNSVIQSDKQTPEETVKQVQKAVEDCQQSFRTFHSAVIKQMLAKPPTFSNVSQNQSERQVEPNAQFVERRVAGDGNCGFTACRTTREKVIGYLNPQDVEVRKLVAPELRGWILMNEGPWSEQLKLADSAIDKATSDILDDIVKDYNIPRESLRLAGVPLGDIIDRWDFYKNAIPGCQNISIPQASLTHYSSLLDKREKLMHDIENSEEVFTKYIDEYYLRRRDYLVLPDPGTTGVLNVIAQKEGKRIRVWKIDDNAPNRNTAYLRYDTGGQGEVVDIIHRHVHFNSLDPSFLGNREFALNQRVSFESLS